MKKWSISVFTF